jgi:DNA-binding NarL/FixJ family response regulator
MAASSARRIDGGQHRMYRLGRAVGNTGGRMAHSILIVEDDELVAKLLRRLAAPYGEPVTAASLAEARRALGKPAASWMALVIDEGLSDGSGLDALEFARRRGIKAPAVLYTGQLSPPLVIRASKLDARYLCKEGGREELQRFLSNAELQAKAGPDPVENKLQEWRRDYGVTKAEKDILLRSAEGQTRLQIAAGRGREACTVKDQERSAAARTGDDCFGDAVKRLLLQAARDRKP